MKPDDTHEWWVMWGFECCRVCGILRREDRKNQPCKGPVEVGPRTVEQSARRAALDELTAESERLGLYDDKPQS